MLEPQKEAIKNIEFWMQPVEGGKFWMGSHDDDSDDYSYEKPRHEVQVSDFFIGKHPVTQALWRAVAQAAPEFGLDENPSFFSGDDLPVEQVSWEDITQKFLPALEKLTGKKYRLPTEAEWEYAARGGKFCVDGYRYAGSDRLKDVGWFNENSGGMTRPVGLKQPNQLGIHDMSGNVMEWCEDWNGDYPTEPQTNPTGAKSGDFRVIRGGGWFNNARDCRVSIRPFGTPTLRFGYVGFRPVGQ